MTNLEKLKSIEDILNSSFVERKDEIHGLLLSTITGLNMLLLGPPGTGKSALVTEFQKLVKGTNKFEKLLSKFTTPEEIFGPFSLKALENDKYYRQTEGYLPQANFAFLDETFKANSAILNSLLDVMNERKFVNGTDVIKVPLITLVGASNEIPEEKDGLGAFFDRFHLIYCVNPIQEKESIVKMLTSSFKNSNAILSLKDIESIKEEINEIQFPNDVYDTYADLIIELRKQGMPATDRTYKTSIEILKAEAYLHGRNKISELDFEVLQNVLWTNPEDKKKLYTTILKIVNPDKEKIFALVTAIDDLYADLEKLKIKTDKSGTTDEKKTLMTKSVEADAAMKDASAELIKYKQKYIKLKKDTSEINDHLDHIQKIHKEMMMKYLGIDTSVDI